MVAMDSNQPLNGRVTPRRILIIRTDRIGDVVMITPMIRELRQRFPDAYLATLTRPATRDIVLRNPHLDAALTDDLEKETFWKTVKELRSHHFTEGLLLLPTERAIYQMFFAGIRNRISVGHRLYSILTFTRGISRNNYTPLRHEADYCMDLARTLGVETENLVPEIFVTADERREAANYLLSRGVSDSDTRLYVHTGTRGSAPNWPEEQYETLVSHLLAGIPDPHVKIVLTAREMSAEFIRRCIARDPARVIDISRDIHDLRKFIILLSAANILISPSTGPAHLGDALDIPCLAIHCHRPMNCATYWGILNHRSVNLEVSDEHCRTHCSADQQHCTIGSGITVEDVVAQARMLLSKKDIPVLN